MIMSTNHPEFELSAAERAEPTDREICDRPDLPAGDWEASLLEELTTRWM